MAKRTKQAKKAEIHRVYVGDQMGKFIAANSDWFSALNFVIIKNKMKLYRISNVYFAVTRNKKRLFARFKVKQCFVGLDAKIADTMRFFKEAEENPSQITKRRATTTATELFCVNDSIVEASCDFWEPVERAQPMQPTQSAHPVESAETIRICNDFDPFKRIKNIPFSIGGRKRALSTFTECSPFASEAK